MRYASDYVLRNGLGFCDDLHDLLYLYYLVSYVRSFARSNEEIQLVFRYMQSAKYELAWSLHTIVCCTEPESLLVVGSHYRTLLL